MKRVKKIIIFSLCFIFICQMQESLFASQYEYEHNRLKKVMYEDGSYVLYQYDKNGNLLSKVFEASDGTEIFVNDDYIEKIKVVGDMYTEIYLSYFNDIKAYEVFRAEESSTEFEKIKEVSSNIFRDRDIQSGITYVYKVKPCYEKGYAAEESYSNEIVAKSLSVPNNVSFNISSSIGRNIMIGIDDQLTMISMNWDEENDATKYEIKESSSLSENAIEVVTNEYSSSNMLNKDYGYQVRAICEDTITETVSAFSKKISFTDGKPNVPQDLRTGTNEVGQLSIFWTPNDEWNNYIIYKSSAKNGPYNFFSGKINTSVNSCICNKGYYYRIVSYRVQDGKMIFSDFSDCIYVE